MRIKPGISALVEGNSIRGIEHQFGIHRDTIMWLGVTVGQACARLHDVYMRKVHAARLELDEIWSFIHTKAKRVRPTDPAEYGDQYTYIALDSANKAVVSYATGKRDLPTTKVFVLDLKKRIMDRPQICSDGFIPYIEAIEAAFGPNVDYAQVVKSFETDILKATAAQPDGQTSAHIEKTAIVGEPDLKHAGTSYVERHNLTMRMQIKRFVRRTIAHSKKAENHQAAVSLYVAYYNFCRVHESLKKATPAMAVRITDHVWSIEELITMAMSIPIDPETAPEPTTPVVPEKPPLSRAAVEKRIHWRDRRKDAPTLRLIQGGLSMPA